MPSGPNAFRYVQALGILAPAALGGYSLAWSTIFVPTILLSPVPLMLTSWEKMYEAGKNTMIPAGALCASLTGYLAYAAHSAGAHPHVVRSYVGAAIGGLLFVPYTILFMVPTNKKLIALNEKVGETRAQYQDDVVAESGETAKQLVDNWGMLNLGRAVIIGLSSFVGIGTALMDKSDY